MSIIKSILWGAGLTIAFIVEGFSYEKSLYIAAWCDAKFCYSR